MTAGEMHTTGETHRAIEATFRIEWARLIAGQMTLKRSADDPEGCHFLQSVGLERFRARWNYPATRKSNEIAGHQARRRPGAGEDRLAATKHDGVEAMQAAYAHAIESAYRL